MRHGLNDPLLDGHRVIAHHELQISDDSGQSLRIGFAHFFDKADHEFAHILKSETRLE